MTNKEALQLLRDAQADIGAIRRDAKRIALMHKGSPLRGPIESLLERAAVHIEHVCTELRIGGLEE
jgi:hypothetical protein